MQKIAALKRLFKNNKPIIFFSILIVCLVVIVAQYNHKINFSYSDKTCINQLTYLPKLHKQYSEGTYGLDYANIKSIKSFPLLALKTCINAVNTPQEDKQSRVYTKLFGLSLFSRKYQIKAGKYVQLNSSSLEEKISIRDPLVFEATSPDKIFSYHLASDNKNTKCASEDNKLICNVADLELKQNSQYNLSISRFFKDDKIEDVSQKIVTTVDPVVVTGVSIPQNGIVYDKPTSIAIKTDKKLVNAKAELIIVEADKESVVGTELSVNDNEVKLNLKQELPRNKTYIVRLKDATSTDKGVLMQPFNMSFITSGGPKVASINIGHTSVFLNQTLIISFDQNLDTKQDISQIISVSGSMGNIEFSKIVKGKQIILSPKKSLPFCANFKIDINNSINSEYGISGDSKWNYSARTICYSTFSIGGSLSGRSLVGYRFGSGASKILFVGNMHGNEKGSKYLLDKWIQELDAKFEKIPSSLSVIVIPSLNPDGFNSDSRTNARGVDLNRNFPTYDWKPDVIMPGGALAVGGGGSMYLSEPESQAIANYINNEKPKLVLTYHSKGSIVSANESGNSSILASKYAQLSRYRNLPKNATNLVFTYDTTGALEDWLYEKNNTPALLIELTSHTSSDYDRNKNAMWAMLE